MVTADGIASRSGTAWLAVARTVGGQVRSVGVWLAPWLDLTIRFWLARIFLTGAAARIVTHVAPAMVGDDRLATLLNAVVSTPLGFVVQTVCPLLLLIGLFSRGACLLLLLQVLTLQVPGATETLHLDWAMLIGWLIVMGPGSLSLDAVLSRGLDTSAVPGARRLGAASAWISRWLGPWYRLVLRLWIATAPLSAALWGAGASTRDPLASWLAALPGMTGMLAPGWLVLAAGMLLLGLGTRLAALILIATIPLAEVGMTLDERSYWLLLLGLLLLHGSGPFSLDRLLTRRIDGAGRKTAPSLAGLPHVVVIGGGFGGTAAVRALRHAPCRITLVDRRNYHLFQPLLYQVATAGLSPADIATPIRALFRTQPNVSVLLADVEGIDPRRREVILRDDRLGYDFLIVSSGSRHSYFGRDDWAPTAPGLKQIEDATDIRRRLLTAFEHAEGSADPAVREAWMTFVIVGGGPTGVELAGAIAELARHGLERDFRSIDPATARVILIQSGPRLLPTFPEALSADAETELKRLGIEVRLDSKVEVVDAGGVDVPGQRIAAKTVLWAAGVQASPAGAWLDAEVDRAGRVVVGPDLGVAPYDNVFAVGDTAASTAWAGKPVPGLAPAAKQGGAHAGRVIRARLGGRPPPPPFRYRHAGSLATIGRQAAVADFGRLRVRGALAWWLWGLVHILFLVGGRNRAAVMLQWAWAYFSYRRGTRLITEPRSAP